MKTTTKLNQDAEPSATAPVRVQPVVGTPRPITPERWQQICRGRVTVRELSTYQPKLKSFRTVYVPRVAGVLLKTKWGLKFKTRAAAEAAGRKCLKGMRLKECPNAKLCDGRE
jgi:hypothetical protein